MEKDTQKECTDYLRWCGWYVIENWRNTGYVAGISDITAIKKGQVLWIEFKSQTGKQRESQKIFESNIKTHGGEYIIIRSLDELMDFLKTDKQGKLL